MTSNLRKSPSGPQVLAGGGNVESVFGRQGDVEADTGDYATSQVTNESTVPGDTVSDALDTLVSSSSRTNESSVPGATVTDALDYLTDNAGPPPRGSLLDTFSGGLSNTITEVDSTTGNIGDKGWNLSNLADSTGPTLERRPAELGAIGVYRLTTPTLAPSGTPAGYQLYLGNRDEDSGPLVWQDVGDITFRARFGNDPGASSEICTVGLVDGIDLGNLISIAFSVSLSSPNYAVSASIFASGTFTADSGVAVDGDFHDFTIRRVGASTIEWLIDGSLVATDTDPLTIPSGTQPLIPRVAAITIASPPVGTTWIDVDTFAFEPA